MCTHYERVVYAFVMDERTHVGVRELRANVASMLRRAASGERIVVTVDGRPQAMLGPIESDATPTMETLFAAGLALPPRATRPNEPSAPTPLGADVRINSTLDAIRGGS